MKKTFFAALAAGLSLCSSVFAGEIDDLAKNTASPEFTVSNAAFKSLGASKDPRAVDALIRILQSAPDSNHRASAAQALSSYESLRDPRAIEPLIQSMRGDAEYMVRANAAIALGEFKDARVIASLLEALRDEQSYVGEQAAGALATLAGQGIKDEKAFAALLALFLDASVASVHPKVALALGAYKDPRAVDPLLVALKSETPLLRAFAASALGSITDPKAIEPLRGIIGDPDEAVRRYVGEALKSLGAGADSVAAAGDLRGALDQYLAEIQICVLCPEPRRKVIALVAKMDPKPVVPEEAQRAMARGKVEFENVRAADQWARPAQEFQTAANLAPWWPDAYFNLAMVQEKQGELYRSKENFQLYLEAAPQAADAAQIKEKIYQIEYKAENRQKSDELVTSAADLQMAGQYAAAIPLLQEAITLEPNSAVAHGNLGHAYEGLGQNKEAMTELKEGIRLGETHYNAFFSLAALYVELEENYDEAIRVMEEGIRLNQYSSEQGEYGPALASMHRNLGSYYQSKNNYPKAIENYEKAISLGHTKADEIRQSIDRIRPYAG